jgi:hypothetical protein
VLVPAPVLKVVEESSLGAAAPRTGLPVGDDPRQLGMDLRQEKLVARASRWRRLRALSRR